MFRNKWLRPLNFSIVAGVILGFISSVNPIREQGYLSYHIYNIANRVLVHELNKSVLGATLILYVYWMVSWLRKPGYWYTRAAVCVAGYSVATVAAILLAQTFYDVKLALHSLFMLTGYSLIWYVYEIVCGVCAASNPVFLETTLLEYSPLLVGLVVLGAGGVLLYRRERRRSGESTVHSVPPHAVARSTEHSSSPRIHPLGLLAVLGLGVLVCANLLNGFFLVKARLDTAGNPNIIIIAMDTTRADHLGCYGYYRPTSPNVDALARGSILFERAYSQAPWTTASFQSLMTSEYPATLKPGTVWGPNPIDQGCLNMPKFLQGQGYATGAAVSNMYFDKHLHADTGFDYFEVVRRSVDRSSPGMLAAAEDLIAKMKNGKFCLFLLFKDPHAPYFNRRGYVFMNGLKKSYPVSLGDCEPRKEPRPDIDELKASYDSGIAFTDHYVGLLIKELKKQNLYDNSLIIFLADHGEEFEDHGALFHGHTLYNELLHVPLVIKLPGQTQGRVVTTDFPLIDVYPSAMKILGCPTPKSGLEGTAVDLKASGSTLPDYDIFAQVEGVFGGGSRPIDLASVQSSGYKYILDLKTHQQQLFDLAADSAEQHNLADDRPALASRFRNIVVARTEEFARRATTSTSNTPLPERSEEEKRELHSIGYATH